MGSPAADMRSYAGGNSRALSLREKKGGKVVTTGTVTVSRDGRTRAVTTSGTDAGGKRFRNVAVYDKQ